MLTTLQARLTPEDCVDHGVRHLFAGLVVGAERPQCLGRVQEHGHEAGADLQCIPLHIALPGDLAVRHRRQHLLQAVAKLGGQPGSIHIRTFEIQGSSRLLKAVLTTYVLLIAVKNIEIINSNESHHTGPTYLTRLLFSCVGFHFRLTAPGLCLLIRHGN